MNGLVDADGTPRPGLAVVKHQMQPVHVEAVDLAAGRVRLTNRYDFADPASRLAGRWAVRVEGAGVPSTKGTL